MLYCPYCGSKTNDDELFCIQCGKKLPEDRYDRIAEPTVSKRIWYLPAASFIISILAVGFSYFYLQHQTQQAKEAFQAAEEKALDGAYDEALIQFKTALQQKDNFPAARENKSFMEVALRSKLDLKQAEDYAGDENYQKSLEKIDEAENNLKVYDGEAVDVIIDEVVTKRSEVQLNQLKEAMENDPSIEKLKTLLWQAKAINSEEAETITGTIEEKIISYIFSTANEQLSQKQFTDARDVVEEGLNYVPDSDKLQSLQTTIEKEKTAFETEQQNRIEQAVTAAEKEQNQNKNDAVEMIDVSISKDDQGKAVVSGKLKSIATVPVYSISVDYKILDPEDDELLTNEVYVYPDTLYPGEEGKFEFTHFDTNAQDTSKVEIEKIKWFLD
ncbi:zinc ribbon domain-containing protein [Sediminibacillus dalangtanensis]|uniref:Zinc ribbon domain-containing protein n=1 Tax=Sediminibacillus dalangtanensis TaxID=2729421 RepID=A0ABX7VTA8_9BACI|nr:zinc ribbon domain-containing protein [Sediminibacillus dalangtanensis]QTM99249.1 zinc ribbon domain-containing protein [Sediminibacillus dalangtanensis]